MTGSTPSLGDRYARLGAWGLVAFIFYYCVTGMFLLLSLIFVMFLPPLFLPWTLLLIATVSLFWRVDKLAFGLGIASLAADVLATLLVLAVLAFAGFFASLGNAWGIVYDFGPEILSVFLGIGLFLVVYCVLSVLFFVRYRHAFGIGAPRTEQERPAPPREDPWAL